MPRRRIPSGCRRRRYSGCSWATDGSSSRAPPQMRWLRPGARSACFEFRRSYAAPAAVGRSSLGEPYSARPVVAQWGPVGLGLEQNKPHIASGGVNDLVRCAHESATDSIVIFEFSFLPSSILTYAAGNDHDRRAGRGALRPHPPPRPCRRMGELRVRDSLLSSSKCRATIVGSRYCLAPHTAHRLGEP